MAERRAVTVEVRPEHIQRGIRGTASRCPLALALLDAGVGPEVYVDVDGWDRGVNTEFVPLTRSARRFVDRFDDGLPVRPRRFRLRWSSYLVPMTPEWHERRTRPDVAVPFGVTNG